MQRFINPGVYYIALIAIFSFLFSACNGRKNSKAEVYQVLEEGVVKANRAINHEIAISMQELNRKLEKPATAIRAQYWIQKAYEIKGISANMYAFVNFCKREIMKSKENKSINALFEDQVYLDELCDSFLVYKQKIFKVDSLFEYNLKDYLVLITKHLDTLITKDKKFPSTYFAKISIGEAVAILNTIQLNIHNNEGSLIAFCNEQVADNILHFDTYSALIGQSSSYVRAGETIEIMAGVGAFSRNANPVFTIMNKNVPIDDNGTAILHIKAPRRPGKHFVPVEITYNDWEGKYQTITKRLEYTVAKEQEQDH